MFDRRMRRRIGQPAHGETPRQHQAGMQDQQRHGAEAVGGRGAGNAQNLSDELQGRGERHRARQPDALGDHRQQGVAGGNGEGADGAGRDAVGDQQRITETARHQHGGERQGRRGVEHVIAQQQAARVAAVGHQATQRQEEQPRRHQGRLRHADGKGIHVQHDRDQPREQHHLDAERHEPGAEAQ
jgi:hypothetical protein